MASHVCAQCRAPIPDGLPWRIADKKEPEVMCLPHWTEWDNTRPDGKIQRSTRAAAAAETARVAAEERAKTAEARAQDAEARAQQAEARAQQAEADAEQRIAAAKARQS